MASWHDSGHLANLQKNSFCPAVGKVDLSKVNSVVGHILQSLYTMQKLTEHTTATVESGIS